MKRILFISCCIPDELELEITKYCKRPHNIHDAANTFQKTLIHGFIENNAVIDVLSVPSLPTSPYGYKKLYIPELYTKIENKVPCYILPYFTFIIGKYASIEWRVTRYLINWINSNRNDELIIMGYNVNPAFMASLSVVKKKYPAIKTALVVTDMIEDADNFEANRTFLKRIQLYLHKRKIVASYKAIDKYILLSEQMKERIPNCTNNYIVIEGIYKHISDYEKQDRQKTIFYSGALDAYGNIVGMIEAFKKISRDDYKLVICGAGPLSSYVSAEAESCSNILFLGSIPRTEVIKWQHIASILINPRQPSEITKYSFPSKTMEYFASGTPVLMYRLQGIPEEYYSYCYTIKGYSVDDLKDSIEEVIALGEYERIILGAHAKEFVLKSKTSKVQVSKLLGYLMQ